MFQNIEIFRQSHAMAKHAAQRQTVIAKNMANADTPGYVAQDVAPFASAVSRPQSGEEMRHTRVGHIQRSDSVLSARENALATGASPNGNSVSLEEEMLKSVEVKQQHDRAIAIYKSSLNILRASLGRR